MAVACAGTSPKAENPGDSFDRTLLGVQDTRCKFQGRKDRFAILTAGRGAKAPNVRRVYSVGDERDGRRVLRCREVDTNLDGAKDVVRTYDEQGRPVLEQSDSDYDGKIDTWIEFSGGMVVRAEFDHDRDGKPDEWKTYSGGHLARVQRDTTRDGKVDTWEVYEQGRLRRLGRDIDGDGRVDQWYRDATKKPGAGVPLPSAEPAEPSPPPASTGASATAAPASTGTSATNTKAAPKAAAAPGSSVEPPTEK
jgi:DNA-binding transcriptional MerR regulator